jgi:hypothetical protein
MPATYDHIASYTVTGSSTANITLSSIPATYTDLEIITSFRCNSTYADDSASIILNSDTGNNYYWTQIKGPISGTPYSNQSGSTGRAAGLVVNDMPSASGRFSSDSISINDYSSTVGYKHVFSKFAGNAPGAFSFMWANTSAINSIRFTCDTAGDTFQIGSTINIYGIKAA